ncbi:MAG TPA: hypothetical protein VJ724_08980, partial [Tahibacter sp.]|nr:hypothetical protein [Tahibacter sp.]
MSRYNPHYPNAPAVFAAAERFKQRCLVDQASLFLDGTNLWTPPHFKALTENYVNRLDVGTGNFFEKLKSQLAGCAPLDVALMCEVFWIAQLGTGGGPGNPRPDTKIDRIQRIWNFNPPRPFPDASPFLAEDVLSGVGGAGQGYNNHLWREIVFAVEAFAEFVAKPRDEREALLRDGWTFAAWLVKVPSNTGRQFYHVLNHVLFPDQFERIFSQSDKHAVMRESKRWNDAFYDDRVALDRALADLRAELEARHPGNVDHYEAPVATLRPERLEVPPATGLVDDPRAVAYDVTDQIPLIRPTTNVILYGPPGTGKTWRL